MIAVTGINKDSVVLDVGSGSGWLSVFLSYYAKQVYTFEKEKNFYDIAKSNIGRFANGNVKIEKRDVIVKGFGKKGANLVTIDLREPHKVLPHAYRSLNEGGWAFCHCPVIEQVKNVCKSLEKLGFSDIRVLQNISQEWKVNPTRPTKPEIGHTAFLVFGRKL
ncbi:MAG: methyltransferase domain-containing protein [Candidatus Aenigmarchaeota archaeon]|nr:methyltransferase domain-containing protein [Candidatus Aenigmarchaeota archaeon]